MIRHGLAAVLSGALATAAGGCRIFTDATPGFLVSPGALSFTARAGGAHPPLQFLSISQADEQPAHWTLVADVPWIGALSSGDTTPYFLGVGVGTELPVGTYSGTVAITRVSWRDVRTVPVTLALLATTPLDGRWAGLRDGVSVTLTLAASGGQVTGAGTLTPPRLSVTVVGAYAYPDVSLSLMAGGDTTTLSGVFVDDNAIAATLNGPQLANVALTIYRQ
ncbi:MAG: hypothetical protein WD773_04820 [Gemmatimonadales bacterium]